MHLKTTTLNRNTSFQVNNLFIKIFQIIFFIWLLSVPLKNAIYQVSTALLILLFVIHVVYYHQKHILLEIFSKYRVLFLLLFLFIASMILSSILGLSEKDVFTDIFKYVLRYVIMLLSLIYFYTQSFFTKKWLFTAILIVLTLHSLDGLYQYITGFDFIKHNPPNRPTYLLTGAVYQHNPFGLFMTLGSILSLVLFFDKTHYTTYKYEKIIYLILLLLFLFTLFHSQSRAAWVMFGVFSLGYLPIYIKENGVDKRLFFTLSFLLISIVIMFLLDDHLSHRLSLLLEGNSAGRTSQIWPFTFKEIKNAPLFGYGIDSFHILFNGMPVDHHAGVHNLTLELLLYTGLLGFLIMYSLIIISLKKAYNSNKIFYGLLLLSYIILLQFDGSLIDSKVHLNIFIIILFFIYIPKNVQKPLQSL